MPHSASGYAVEIFTERNGSDAGRVSLRDIWVISCSVADCKSQSNGASAGKIRVNCERKVSDNCCVAGCD